MDPVPAFPGVADAMAAVQAGLRFLAAADATQMSAQAQAEALQMMERATAVMTAARASVLSAFTAGQGYCADADYSPRAWLVFILSFRVSQGCDLRRLVVDSVADGTLAA